MADYTMERFQKDCADMHVMLSEGQLQQFQRYFALLQEWNSFMNLTAITEFEEVLKKHFLDSLSVAKSIGLPQVHALIDIGTGAGFPGIPLKIAFPHLKVVLLDSLGKRVKFLKQVTQELKLSEVEAIHGRAEDFARDALYREQFDLVVSRAVANLSSLSEYCIPYAKQSGLFVSYKSGNIEEELKSARFAVKTLGGEIEKVDKFSLLNVGERSLVVIRKTKSTPKKYPRKAGVPSREPIIE